MRQLLVYGTKTFKISVPEGAKITFGPWSPPRTKETKWDQPMDTSRGGTLRIYQGTKDNIIACFSNVNGFRDLSLGYAEEVAKEEGATIWKDDEQGYVRESKVAMKRKWVEPQIDAKVVEHDKKRSK
jgi:hypothetical protein